MPANLPRAPYFYTDAEVGFIEVDMVPPTHKPVKKRGSALDHEYITYDANLVKWKMTYRNPGLPFWRRVLGATPKLEFINAPVTWIECGVYKIDELQAVFLKALENDDDVLTQFVEGDILVQRVKQAATFEDFWAVWKLIDPTV